MKSVSYNVVKNCKLSFIVCNSINYQIISLTELRNGWLIRTASKSFAVYAATSTEKQEWMAHINKCIEDLLRKSGKKAVEVHAAVWVPDSEANICMHCKRTQFTVLNRRVSILLHYIVYSTIF